MGVKSINQIHDFYKFERHMVKSKLSRENVCAHNSESEED